WIAEGRIEAVPVEPQLETTVTRRCLDVPSTALVHPHHDWRERAPGTVDGNDRHVLARDDNGGDLVLVTRDDRSRARPDGRPPGVGVLLRAAIGEERRRQWR